jgi:hypothetical protein
MIKDLAIKNFHVSNCSALYFDRGILGKGSYMAAFTSV